ncbi:glycosyltransferase family 4 protein [Tessaracoccus flavus]|nr:Glycosyltransferase involved in cell wall bisynthesis [Tessaracoccus flavus]
MEAEIHEREAERGPRRGVLVLMPKDARTATGPVSVWLTAAGWAEAAQEAHGAAWMVTPSGILDGGEARLLATSAPRATLPPAAGWKRLIPTTLKTLRKDVLSWRHARSFREAGLEGPWEPEGPLWIWHHHEPFHDSGFVAKRRFGCPVVVFVDAPTVWESGQWGVKRPGWGRLLERFGEVAQLRDADLIACVTEEVANEVIRLGGPRERVIVTPTAVALDRFNEDVSGAEVRARYGLEGRTVVGWVGTFHKFHGLDLLVEAYAAVERERRDTSLLLVGDGQDRPRIEALVDSFGLRQVVFAGAVPQDQVPSHLAAMDVASVVDPGTGSFHYSPLKLKEYLACGRAVVAPASGQVARYVADGTHALLVPAGDAPALTRALLRLVDDPGLRSSLGAAGNALVRETGTWAHQLRTVEDALTSRGWVSA